MRYIVTLFLVIILISGFLLWQGFYYSVDPSSDEIVLFTINKGQGVREIGNNLARANLIRYSFFFKIYLYFNKQGRSLKAGDYELSKSLTMSEIVSKIVAGDVIKKTITIIEGWDIGDISEYLEKEKIAMIEATLDFDNKEQRESYFSKSFSFLADKPKNNGLEGYLFPDTYSYSIEDKLEDIIKRMLSNFDKMTKDLRAEISSQRKTVFEIIIMASMLEKEVKTLEDKKMVAGVLFNRLEIGMPLQVDSTITYITKKNTTAILKEELEIDSLYNTYKYRGLPYGPISNPGIESIKAAIYPTENNYLYYLSTKEGETIFSKTLQEHNQAINKYLR